ncbi:DNA gyrase subunit B [Streptomyces sp. NPDC056503]|uniref:DNA gyrase subunit B n=1 Tax=Streptomyces sp. NPDC056503 TaxID=3345842 RepID=UPI00369A6671
MGEQVRYEAARIEVIEGLGAVRRRPGLYVGSTGPRGLHHMVLGVFEHAVNETAAGDRRVVEVTLTADGGVRIADDGPGVPFGAPADDGGPGLEERLCHFHAGRSAVGRDRIDLGSGGIRLTAANALSTRMTAESHRGGGRRVQEFARGTALAPPAVAGPTDRTGTTLTFHPDPGIFETVDCSFGFLGERFRELAYLCPGLDVTLTDERPAGGPAVQRYRFPDGVRDFVVSLASAHHPAPPTDVLAFGAEDPRMAGVLDVALVWGAEGRGQVLGYANGRATPHGGTHLEGFRRGLANALASYTRACGPDSGADEAAGAGVTAVVSVRLDEPEFVGCALTELGGDAVRPWVEEAVRERVLGWLEEDAERAARVVGAALNDAGPDGAEPDDAGPDGA